jgi:hypothetical protein
MPLYWIELIPVCLPNSMFVWYWLHPDKWRASQIRKIMIILWPLLAKMN